MGIQERYMASCIVEDRFLSPLTVAEDWLINLYQISSCVGKPIQAMVVLVINVTVRVTLKDSSVKGLIIIKLMFTFLQSESVVLTWATLMLLKKAIMLLLNGVSTRTAQDSPRVGRTV
jgi:hypothetical protein